MDFVVEEDYNFSYMISPNNNHVLIVDNKINNTHKTY